MTLYIERAQSWRYQYGIATVQLIRGESDSPCRLWNGEPQAWWNIPKHPAYHGMAESIYARMVDEEERLHRLYKKEAQP